MICLTQAAAARLARRPTFYRAFFPSRGGQRAGIGGGGLEVVAGGFGGFTRPLPARLEEVVEFGLFLGSGELIERDGASLAHGSEGRGRTLDPLPNRPEGRKETHKTYYDHNDHNMPKSNSDGGECSQTYLLNDNYELPAYPPVRAPVKRKKRKIEARVENALPPARKNRPLKRRNFRRAMSEASAPERRVRIRRVRLARSMLWVTRTSRRLSSWFRKSNPGAA